MRTIKTAIAIVLIAMTLTACGNPPNQQADVRSSTDEELLDQKRRELETATEFIDKLWEERGNYINTIITLHDEARRFPTRRPAKTRQSLITNSKQKLPIVDNALLPKITTALTTIATIDNLMRKTHSKEDYDYLMINLQEMRKTLEMRKKKITQKKF